MKARVKATGRVIEVINVIREDGKGVWEDMSVISTNPTQYHSFELDFIDLPKDLQCDEPDYWDKLKHQYAGQFLQGMIIGKPFTRYYVEDAYNYATSLIEKLKNEK